MGKLRTIFEASEFATDLALLLTQTGLLAEKLPAGVKKFAKDSVEGSQKRVKYIAQGRPILARAIFEPIFIPEVGNLGDPGYQPASREKRYPEIQKIYDECEKFAGKRKRITVAGSSNRYLGNENEFSELILRLSFIPDELQSPLPDDELEKLVDKVRVTCDWLEAGLGSGVIKNSDIYQMFEAMDNDPFATWAKDVLSLAERHLKPLGIKVAGRVEQGIDQKLTKPMQNAEAKVTAWSDDKVAAAKDNRPGWRKILEFWKD